MLHSVKKLDYLCSCKSEISNGRNAVDGHCLQAMEIVRHNANGCFDWLISGYQSVNPIAYGGGFLSHTTILLAATLKPLKLLLPNVVTSCFYLFATI